MWSINCPICLKPQNKKSIGWFEMLVTSWLWVGNKEGGLTNKDLCYSDIHSGRCSLTSILFVLSFSHDLVKACLKLQLFVIMIEPDDENIFKNPLIQPSSSSWRWVRAQTQGKNDLHVGFSTHWTFKSVQVCGWKHLKPKEIVVLKTCVVLFKICEMKTCSQLAKKTMTGQ